MNRAYPEWMNGDQLAAEAERRANEAERLARLDDEIYDQAGRPNARLSTKKSKRWRWRLLCLKTKKPFVVSRNLLQSVGNSMRRPRMWICKTEAATRQEAWERASAVHGWITSTRPARVVSAWG